MSLPSPSPSPSPSPDTSSSYLYSPSADSAHYFYVCGTAKVVGFFVGSLLLAHIRHCQRRIHTRQQYSYGAYLILPVYVPLIYCIMLGLLGEATLAFFHFNTGWDPFNTMTWALYEMLRDVFPLLFLQKSLSSRSFKRTALLSLLPISHGLISSLFLYLFGLYSLYYYHGVAVLYHLAIFTGLKHHLYRRDCIRIYSLYMIIYRCVWLLYTLNTSYSTSHSPFAYFSYYAILCTIGLLEMPLTLIWYVVMNRDTKYWRYGCAKQQKALIPSLSSSSSLPSSSSPSTDHLAISLLSDASDHFLYSPALHEMLDRNERENVFIDFSLIRCSPNDLIGMGRNSRVYEGQYKGKRVALKFFAKHEQLIEVTEAHVHALEKEVRIAVALAPPSSSSSSSASSSLSSPSSSVPSSFSPVSSFSNHLVGCYGMCVAPPSIFLVMEYINGPNLFDFIHTRGHRASPSLPPYVSLSLRSRVLLCCQAIASLEGLHSVSIMHRDIKSSNFIIHHNEREGQLTLKLIDFGLSRAFREDEERGKGRESQKEKEREEGGTSPTRPSRLRFPPPLSFLSSLSSSPSASIASSTRSSPFSSTSSTDSAYSPTALSQSSSSVASTMSINSPSTSSPSSFSFSGSDSSPSSPASAPPSCSPSPPLTGGVGTLIYMSPQVFWSQFPPAAAAASSSSSFLSSSSSAAPSYTSLCDVYSLSIVLYEIIFGRVPYSDIDAEDFITMVMGEGERPDTEVRERGLSSKEKEAYALIKEALEKGWADKEEKRSDVHTLRRQFENILSTCFP